MALIDFDKIAKAVEGAVKDASDWTEQAAKDAADWTGQAVKDAAEWTGQAATDAVDWTGQAVKDAAEWTEQAAKDVAEWTEQAIKDASNAAVSFATNIIVKLLKGVNLDTILMATKAYGTKSGKDVSSTVKFIDNLKSIQNGK